MDHRSEHKIITMIGILYIPLSFFSWLLGMASDGTLDATHPIYIGLTTLFCVIASLIPLLCVAGVWLSVRFQNRGDRTRSLVFLFLPLAVFLLDLVLLAVASTFPTTV